MTFGNVRTVSANAELHGHRVRLLAQCLYKSVIQTSDVLVPVSMFRMTLEQILRSKRPVRTVRLDLHKSSAKVSGDVGAYNS